MKGQHQMIGASKILTVSYGTFSCTLEGFDEPFNTMKAIAEYFRDLAAGDRYFGAEPPTPDAAMLHAIAEREINRRVDARVQDNGVILRAGPEEVTAEAAPPAAAPSVIAAPLAAPLVAEAPPPASPLPAYDEDDATPSLTTGPAPTSVAETLSRLRALRDSAPASEPPGVNDTAYWAEDEEAAAPAPVPAPVPVSLVADAAMVEEPVLEEPAHEEPAHEEAVHDEPILDEPVLEEAALEEPAFDEPAPEETAADAPEMVNAPAQDEAFESAMFSRLLESTAVAAPEPEAARVAEVLFVAEPVLVAETVTEPEVLPEVEFLAEAEAEEAEEAEANLPESDLLEPETASESMDIALDDETDAFVFPMVAEAEALPENAPMRPRKIRRLATRVLTEGMAAAEPAPQAAPAPAPVPAPASETATPALQRARARLVRVRRTEILPGSTDAPLVLQAPKSPLTAEAEADLAAELADLRQVGTPQAPASRNPRTRILDENNALDRIIAQTDDEFERPETRRKLSAILHLKAAVASTDASRRANPLQDTEPKLPQENYRRDLDRVVRASRIMDFSAQRPAPLVLVSAQRIDRPRGPAPAISPVQIVPSPAPQNLARDEDEDAAPDAGAAGNIFAEAGAQSFAEFVEALGVMDLAETLEAAAIYNTIVLNRPEFTRTHLFAQVEAVTRDAPHPLEEVLGEFGDLLREGRMRKLRKGVFAAAEATPLMIEAKRIAG